MHYRIWGHLGGGGGCMGQRGRMGGRGGEGLEGGAVESPVGCYGNRLDGAPGWAKLKFLWKLWFCWGLSFPSCGLPPVHWGDTPSTCWPPP